MSLKVILLPGLNIAAEGSDAVMAEPVVTMPRKPSFPGTTPKSEVKELYVVVVRR